MQSQPCWKANRSTSPQRSGTSVLHPKRLPQALREPCGPAHRSTPSGVPFQKLLPMQEQSSMPPCDRFPWCFERACAPRDLRTRNTSTGFLRGDLCGRWPSIITIVITSHYNILFMVVADFSEAWYESHVCNVGASKTPCRLRVIGAARWKGHAAGLRGLLLGNWTRSSRLLAPAALRRRGGPFRRRVRQQTLTDPAGQRLRYFSRLALTSAIDYPKNERSKFIRSRTRPANSPIRRSTRCRFDSLGTRAKS